MKSSILKMVWIMGLFGFLSCINRFANTLATPEDIARFEIDLSKEHSFVTPVDFKTHTGHVKGDDKAGYYTIAITSESLESNSQGNTIWEELNKRNQEKFVSQAGEIDLQWTYSDGTKQQMVGKWYAGSGAFGQGIGIGGGWLPSRDKQEISEVEVTVAKVDTFLAQNLKSPKIWIYRGGGK